MIAEDSSNPTEATERLLDRLAKTRTNAEFLATLSKDI
jgi:transcription termination factor Rho